MYDYQVSLVRVVRVYFEFPSELAILKEFIKQLVYYNSHTNTMLFDFVFFCGDNNLCVIEYKKVALSC